MSTSRWAIIGGGWAGLAAAVAATEAGHLVTVFEAARHWGGRARAITTPHGVVLDNGQHILIGAYTATLGLMQRLGVDLKAAFHAQPLALPFIDGSGLQPPSWARHWRAPWDSLAALLRMPGWSWRDKAQLMRTALHWHMQGFQCAPDDTVAALCQHLSPRVREDFIAPLCVSALNTPMHAASASVFLRVLRDALTGPSQPPWCASTLLLPRLDLSQLLPLPAVHWLSTRHADLRLGQRVHSVQAQGSAWHVDGEVFDHVVLAATSTECARLAAPIHPAWAAQAQALRFEAITTVYAQGPATLQLAHPLLALRPGPNAPAQVLIDRGQLGGPPGLLAAIISASDGPRDVLQQHVLQQLRQALQLDAAQPLQALSTVVEKRATFACTPGLLRPPAHIAPGLHAAGDFIAGPYPATLEGAVRSGLNITAAPPP